MTRSVVISLGGSPLSASWLALRPWFGIAILALALVGCATSGTRSSSDAVSTDGTAPAGLEQRALERWQHLIAGDMDKAYEYLTPGYRQTRSLDRYKAGARAGALAWTNATWRNADCVSAESCTVTVLLTYTVRMAGAGDVPGFRPVQERWIKSGGTWYHLPER